MIKPITQASYSSRSLTLCFSSTSIVQTHSNGALFLFEYSMFSELMLSCEMKPLDWPMMSSEQSFGGIGLGPGGWFEENGNVRNV